MVIWVEPSTALDNLEDSPGIGSRIIDKTVFGLGVTSRDGLTRDLLVAGSLDGEGRRMHLVQRHDARRPVRHLDCAGGCMGRCMYRCIGKLVMSKMKVEVKMRMQVRVK